MANEEHLAVLKKGVKAWNTWRARYPQIIPDLSEAILSEGSYVDEDPRNIQGVNFDQANLHKTKLRDAQLYGCSMRLANLANADLCGATLQSSNLVGAVFQNASLDETDLSFSFLMGADFSGAFLRKTNFTLASLKNADFEKAVMMWTVFGDNDLSEVRGLETATHDGPTVVGIEAIYASKGKIPEEFLRNCGVPENLIRYIPALVNSEEGIQFYSCFISYSFRDEEFARRLHSRMRDAHLRVWFAPEDIQGGKKLHEQIETAIHVYDKLLIVLSEASLQSEWVMTELRKARQAERQTGKRKLFPVRLMDFETLRDWKCFDGDGGKDLTVELREYFIPDFSNWKNHDSFETAFNRLLKDLKT